MKKNLSALISCILVCFSCAKNVNEKKIDTWKKDIMKTELEFSNMAQKEGMNKAFLAFVADDAVMLRGDKLIKGKDSIKSFMKKSTSKGLSWKPDFVDVSTSGDLGYTYGKYTYKYKDSLGNDNMSEGIFHTVWKRQPDGNWKFVWD